MVLDNLTLYAVHGNSVTLSWKYHGLIINLGEVSVNFVINPQPRATPGMTWDLDIVTHVHAQCDQLRAYTDTAATTNQRGQYESRRVFDAQPAGYDIHCSNRVSDVKYPEAKGDTHRKQDPQPITLVARVARRRRIGDSDR